MTLSDEAIAEAARALLMARGDHRALEALPADCRPGDRDDGYAIQQAFADLWGLEQGGWKLACTSAEAREIIGAGGPFYGRLFRPFMAESPAELAVGAFLVCGLEGEFAFKLGADLPVRDAPYTRDEVAAAVASLHPAIEIVDSRFKQGLQAGFANLLADNAAAGAFVCGPAAAAWRDLELARHAVRMEVNGAVDREGVGGDALGHPLDALTWLANERSGQAGRFGDGGLKAGEMVTTGTCTGVYFAKPGDVARADFGALGEVRMTFTA